MVYNHENLSLFFGPVETESEAIKVEAELQETRQFLISQNSALSSSTVGRIHIDFGGNPPSNQTDLPPDGLKPVRVLSGGSTLELGQENENAESTSGSSTDDSTSSDYGIGSGPTAGEEQSPDSQNEASEQTEGQPGSLSPSASETEQTGQEGDPSEGIPRGGGALNVLPPVGTPGNETAGVPTNGPLGGNSEDPLNEANQNASVGAPPEPQSGQQIGAQGQLDSTGSSQTPGNQGDLQGQPESLSEAGNPTGQESGASESGTGNEISPQTTPQSQTGSDSQPPGGQPPGGQPPGGQPPMAPPSLSELLKGTKGSSEQVQDGTPDSQAKGQTGSETSESPQPQQTAAVDQEAVSESAMDTASAPGTPTESGSDSPEAESSESEAIDEPTPQNPTAQDSDMREEVEDSESVAQPPEPESIRPPTPLDLEAGDTKISPQSPVSTIKINHLLKGKLGD